MHTNWRDCKAWETEGLSMSTTSNEACKLYDAGLTQYIGWYDDPSVGGLDSTCKRLLSSDPNFVMGKVLAYGLDLLGTGRSTRIDPSFKKDIDELSLLAEKTSITDRERLHVDAIKSWSNGDLVKASYVWENILIEHPKDLLALKMAHDTYFFMGQAVQIRDSIARVLPRWKKSTPLFGYLHGMYAFGLEETNLYDEALKHAYMGLELNSKDAWATHAVAHVMEMTGPADKGIKFMTDTENDWATCGMLACHTYWHLALYYIDKGMFESALGVFDDQIGRRFSAGTLLDLVDASSLLYRLQLEGVNVGDRWETVYSMSKSHLQDNVFVFNDVHILMSAIGGKHYDATDTILKSMKNFINSCKDHYEAGIAKEIGLDMCRAFLAYDAQNYEEVVRLMEPLKYKFVDIGGSHAQRDVFNLLLINAALRSPVDRHKKLARCLLVGRQSLKACSGLTDRLVNMTRACHTD